MDEGWQTSLLNLYQNRDKKERQKRESQFRRDREERERNKSGTLQASETKKHPTMENSSSAYQSSNEVILHDLKDICCNTKTTGKSYIPQTDDICSNHKRRTPGITPSIQYITTMPKELFPGSDEEAHNNKNILLPNQVDYS